MTLNLDVVIDTEEHTVDMKAGLDSLQGVSDATRCIAEAILTERTPHRQSHKGKVRTNLKQSFKGSYGQIFSIDIYDEELQRKFNQIGKTVFSELISYFISEALYMEPRELSSKAQKIVESLGETADDLVKQLRVSALENIHEISTKFNHAIKIRYRKSRDEQIELAVFNRTTAKVLYAAESDTEVDITVSITRLNINTGNGRLLEQGQVETVAFGFASEYKEVRLSAKKIFSENLDQNNGLDVKDWKFLKLRVLPIKLKDGKIVKYIVKGFFSD